MAAILVLSTIETESILCIREGSNPQKGKISKVVYVSTVVEERQFSLPYFKVKLISLHYNVSSFLLWNES